MITIPVRASIQQAVERAIAGLSTRDAIRIGGEEFRVRALLGVASWQQHTEPCKQAGSLVVGEDACGNVYLCAPDGSVSFWDHETNQETLLAATMEEFCDSLVEPTPVVLQPGQIKSACMRECFQSGFGLNWEMFAVSTRREDGAYSEESVTDEQRSRDGKQPQGRPNAL